MDYTELSENELYAWLNQNLDAKRMEHSWGTAEYAQQLAQKYGFDSKKAYFAGLLHDCAKCFSQDKLQNIIEEKLNIGEDEKMSPKTWHAPVSAYVAENDLKVKDEEILGAIRWHTIGREDMSDFEKIIFIADKVETRTRKRDYLDNVRTILDEDNGLNKAMLVCYKETIKSLVERNLIISPITVYIYNQLQKQLNVN